MKKIFLAMIFLATLAHAKEWEENWAKGIEAVQNQKLEDAEFFFTAAIMEFKYDYIHDHPYVYVDRASAYMALGKYEEALWDLKVAMINPYLIGKDYVRALIIRKVAAEKLNLKEEFEKCKEKLKEIHRIIEERN